MSTSTQPPIPESEWAEFASRGWCEEANRYLQEQAALHPEALTGVEWSVTERWQNAPPHLGFEDNVAGFWFTISAGKIEVGAGPAAEADTEIDGDYNAILPIGWTIYAGDTEIQARAQREYGHLSRSKPVKMKGEFPSHPPLLPFLGGLHDHMARRTINNPDIEHRIEHYGLRDNSEALANQGHTMLDAAFTEMMADELRAAGGCGRLWEEAVVHPWVLALVEQELGARPILVWPERGSAGDSSVTATWALSDDASNKASVGSIAIALNAPIASEPDGTMQVIYASRGSTLSRQRIEVDPDQLERNPPVFRSLCGLDS